MHIKKFLDEDYTDYAVYRIYQRLPHILDSLGQTQRKILYVLEKLPESKKVKTAEVYSHVYSGTQYLHGDMSVYNVVENMARECSNNLNLLTTEGSFGYRTSKAAASPRYTSTRFSRAARLIFRPEDEPIYDTQEFEGKPIEPKNLLPILPVNLVNGYNAIAVGFASKFLPRDPTEVIESMIQSLQYKKRKNAKWDTYKCPTTTPAFPYYSGQVVHDVEHADDSAWYLTGALKKTKTRNIVEVTDVPPESSRESYIKKLNRLLDRGIIREYKEECAKNTFKIRIKVSPDVWKQSEDELMDTLGLVDKVVENFTFLNPFGSGDDTVIKFTNSSEYLKYFIDLRQEQYAVRKAYQIDKLTEDILVLKERIRFIEAVNASEIIITRRKKSDLEVELKAKEYQPVDGNYDHLLGMKMYALTEENISRFEKYILEKQKELDNLIKASTEDLHIKELKELLKFIKPELEKKGIHV